MRTITDLLTHRRHPNIARTGSADLGDLVPVDPLALGLVAVEVPQGDVEPLHLLANECRRDLRSVGFTDEEIDDWARQFVARRGPSGTESDLVAFIRSTEAWTDAA